jgi:hypothetical protein
MIKKNMSAKETAATVTNIETPVVKKSDLITLITNGYKTLTDKSVDPKSNKSLKDRIAYTLKGYEKDAKSVAKDALVQLVEDINEAVSKLPKLAPIEASPKPTLSGKKSPTSAPAKETAKAEETPKQGQKKVLAKKLGQKKVETEPDTAKEKIPVAIFFPDELENEDFGKMTACPDKYKTITEIAKAVEDGKTIVLTAYWTKRHLKEYEYSKAHNDVPVPKDGFPNDLDTLQVIYVCSGTPGLYAISSYTEAMFFFNEADLQRVEFTGIDDEKHTMRYSNGMEFEVYEAEDNAEEADEEEEDTTEEESGEDEEE